MPQAIAETVFDICYLTFALVAGLTMFLKGKEPLVKKAGLMAALLGAGDSFHLVPRAYALWTDGYYHYCHFCAGGKGDGRFRLSLYAVGGGIIVWVLSACRPVQRNVTDYRYADDPENIGLCLDRADGVAALPAI